MKTDFEFKKVVLKCLLSGGVSDENKEKIISLLREKKGNGISVRFATDEEERAQWEQNQYHPEPRQEPDESDTDKNQATPKNYFDRNMFLKALKEDFDNVKEWFFDAFDIELIVVIFEGKVKPNLNQ